MNRFAASTVAIIFTAAALGTLAVAQSAGNPSGGGLPIGGTRLGRDLMSQEQFDKLAEYADRARRLTKEDKAQGKTLADVLAEDKKAAAALVRSMPLSCDVTDALQVAQGPVTADGRTVNTKTYEAACANGVGYFLVSQDTAPPYGFSCFAADATRAADVAAGRQPGLVCQLPQNLDMKKMGTQMLAKAGVTCSVNNYRWVGQNAANHTEFDEFACSDGKGYMVITALPGADIPVHVETCPQSAARGLPCKFSDNGAPILTLQTLRDALAKHHVQCDATEKTMRVVGQENAHKRYVVEFQCPQQPNGLVAYLPLDGNTAPFEALDCASAKKRGVICTLTKPRS